MAVGKGTTNAAQGGAPIAVSAAPAGLPFDPTHYNFDSLFRPAQDADETDPISMLIIGPQGSWKTSSLVTIPRVRTFRDGTTKPVRVLYLDSDQRRRVIPAELIPHWTIVSVPYDPDASQAVYEKYRAVSHRMRTLSDEERFDVIVLDTTTPLMKTLWDMARNTVTDEDRYSPDYQDNKKRYGFVQQEAEKIIFSLKATCDLFICITHEKDPFWGEKDANKAKYTADLTGGLKTLLPKLFQEVYFTLKNPGANGDWWWLTVPMGKREARNSYGLPELVPQRYDLILNRQADQFAEYGTATSRVSAPDTEE